MPDYMDLLPAAASDNRSGAEILKTNFLRGTKLFRYRLRGGSLAAERHLGCLTAVHLRKGSLPGSRQLVCVQLRRLMLWFGQSRVGMLLKRFSRLAVNCLLGLINRLQYEGRHLQ
jgi:hypothetical protein